MEQFVAILALIVTGPLVGIEFGVAAVFNPLADKLPDSGFRTMRSGGAKWLGLLMPFWYVVALVALVALAFVTGAPLDIAAASGMVVAQVLSLAVLVPINSRITKWRNDTDVDRALAARWDRFHWLRTALLAATFALLAISIA